MLTVQHIKSICSTDTYNNGRLLCQPGKIRKVQTVEVDKDIISAKALVLGNFGYFHSVQLTLNAQKRNVVDGFDCDCYESTCRKGLCRHCVALALSLAEDGEIDLGYSLPHRNQAMNPVETNAPQDPESPPSLPFPSALPDAQTINTSENPTVIAAAEPVTAKPADQIPHEEPAEQTVLPSAEQEYIPRTNGDLRGMEILLGHELPSAFQLADDADALPQEEAVPMPLVWQPNNTELVFHTNTGIIGTMGTGKTQFTKSLITQLYRQQDNNYDGRPLGILIFDYKGDYNNSKKDFVEATNAKVLRPFKIPYNPLAIVETKTFKPLLPVHTANTFKDTISRVYHLGPKQQTVLFQCIMKAYGSMGIRAEAPETWKNVPPTFDTVYEIYEQDEDIPKADSLAAAMQKLQQFQIFEDDPYHTESLFNLLKGVVVMDMSGYDPDIQSLIVAITLDQFYSQMHGAGSSATDGVLRQLTKLILVDEADNFMREDFPALKKIMKEGREFGVGTILSTQLLEHFTSGDDDYSKYIMTWIVHNVSDLKKSDVEYVFKTKQNSKETSDIYEIIRQCDRFQSVIKIGNAPVHHIRDKAFFELL